MRANHEMYWVDGIPVGGLKISNLHYVDDATMFMSIVNQMKEENATENRKGEPWIRTKIECSKTNIIIVDRAQQ